MKLTVFIGSPRGSKSNSTFLINHFETGFCKNNNNIIEYFYLNKINKTEENLEAFYKADNVIIIFPLYTDSMPGIVKEFIERIDTTKFETVKKLSFIVQSGFPEAKHSSYIARYLEKLCPRLKCTFNGIVTKGEIEGIQIKPTWMIKNTTFAFTELGEYYAEKLTFNHEIVKNLQKPYRLSKGTRVMLRIMKSIGLTNFYWNMKLKENNAYEKRFDKPYIN